LHPSIRFREVDMGSYSPSANVGENTRTREIVSIQYLRAIAAIAVIVHHLSSQIAVTPYMTYYISKMASGVDLFFVISGFVMAWSVLEGRKSAPLDFFGRRLVRIVPLYWLVTAFMTFVLLIAPHLMRTAELSWPHVLGSLMFVPVTNPVTGSYLPLAIPGWTLNYEMAFYFVFAAALGLSRGSAHRTLLITSLAIFGLVLAGGWFKPAGIAGFYTKPLILEFVFGMIVAAITRTALPVPFIVLLCVAVVAGLILFLPPDFGLDRAIRRGVPAGFVVAAAAWMVVPRLRLPQLLGDASYSIYLSHIVTVSVTMKLAAAMDMLDTPALRAISMFGGTILCVAVGVVVWVVVELPVTRSLQERLHRARVQPVKSARDGARLGNEISTSMVLRR
jgi:exopolysaccharide production protein ExoZ